MTTTTEDDLAKVDQKLEETHLDEPAREASPPAAAVNGTPVPENTETTETAEAPAAAVASEEAPSKEPEVPVQEEAIEPEKPKDPAPTPVAPKAAAAAPPAVPSKPAAPKSWAALLGSGPKVATPVVPTAATPQAPSQPKSTTSAANQPLAAPAPAPAREPSPANSQGEAAGWQTAGTKKEQSRGQTQASSDADQKRAYIKSVYSQVDEGALKTTLSKFGEIDHLDISRQKV